MTSGNTCKRSTAVKWQHKFLNSLLLLRLIIHPHGMLKCMPHIFLKSMSFFVVVETLTVVLCWLGWEQSLCIAESSAQLLQCCRSTVGSAASLSTSNNLPLLLCAIHLLKLSFFLLLFICNCMHSQAAF